MAVIRVKSTGDDSDGSTWAKAVNSFHDAKITGAAVGSIIWVDYEHVELYAGSLNPDFLNGTNASPIRVISVDSSDDSYSSRGAKVGATATYTIAGCVEFYGMKIESSTGDIMACDNNDEDQTYDDCLITAGTGGGDDFQHGGQRSNLQCRNCTIQLGDHLRSLTNLSSIWEFTNCDIQLVGADAGLVVVIEDSSQIIFRCCDLTDWDTICEVADPISSLIVSQCQMKPSFNLFSGTISTNSKLLLERSHSTTDLSAPKLGLQELIQYEGTIKAVLTQYRTGGADTGETQPHSWQMAATANSLEYYRPLRTPWCVRWVDGGSEITLTFYVAGAAEMQNDEFWIELITPDETGVSTTLADVRTSIVGSDKSAGDKGDPLDSPANLTADAVSTWNGADVGTKRKITFTFTPDIAGPLKFRACFARAATGTVYFDPKVVVT